MQADCSDQLASRYSSMRKGPYRRGCARVWRATASGARPRSRTGRAARARTVHRVQLRVAVAGNREALAQAVHRSRYARERRELVLGDEPPEWQPLPDERGPESRVELPVGGRHIRCPERHVNERLGSDDDVMPAVVPTGRVHRGGTIADGVEHLPQPRGRRTAKSRALRRPCVDHVQGRAQRYALRRVPRGLAEDRVRTVQHQAADLVWMLSGEDLGEEGPVRISVHTDWTKLQAGDEGRQVAGGMHAPRSRTGRFAPQGCPRTGALRARTRPGRSRAQSKSPAGIYQFRAHP